MEIAHDVNGVVGPGGEQLGHAAAASRARPRSRPRASDPIMGPHTRHRPDHRNVAHHSRRGDASGRPPLDPRACRATVTTSVGWLRTWRAGHRSARRSSPSPRSSSWLATRASQRTRSARSRSARAASRARGQGHRARARAATPGGWRGQRRDDRTPQVAAMSELVGHGAKRIAGASLPSGAPAASPGPRAIGGGRLSLLVPKGERGRCRGHVDLGQALKRRDAGRRLRLWPADSDEPTRIPDRRRHARHGARTAAATGRWRSGRG